MDPTNRNTALASALAEELARCGMRLAVLSPGSRSTPLALALSRETGIEVKVILDERSAAYFALGAAQASGTPVAVLCTSGTAAANLHPAVCEADEAAVPLVVLTADRPPELRGIGAGQTIDQLKLYGSAVRWFCEVGTHEADDAGLLHYRSIACRAFAAARGDPHPGPVHLNLAWRDPLGPEPGPGEVTARSELALRGRDGAPLTEVVRSAPALAPSEVDRLARRVEAAPRGLIVAGRQVDPELAPALARLAAAAGYPILAEPTSQVRWGPHERSLVVATYDSILRSPPPGLAPELVLRFGEMPTSASLRRWLASSPGLGQIVVDPWGAWNEPTRRADLVTRTAGADLAERLAERIGRRGAADYARAWAAAERAADAAIAVGLAELGQRLTEPGIHRALGGVYRDGEIVYTASSMPIRDQEAFLRSGGGAVRFLCNRGANGIDGLVSSGIGAATATGSPTWIVTGELGLLHDSNGLAALRLAEAPVRLLAIDNGGGRIFDFLPQARQVEPDEMRDLLTTPATTDLEALSAAHRIPYRRLERLEDLERHAAESGLIHLPVDPADNVAMHADLAERAAAAAAATLH